MIELRYHDRTYKLAALIMFYVILIVSCANQSFNANKSEPGEEAGEPSPDANAYNNPILDSTSTPEPWDLHAREIEKWRGRADYYSTRKPKTLDDDYLYSNSVQGSPVPDLSRFPDLCSYTASRNVNCRLSDYPESSLIAILMQGEEAHLLYLNPTFTHGKFALLNNSQCWIPLDLMDGPSDPLKMCTVYVVDAPSMPDLGASNPPACSSDLDETSCAAAGGTWVSGGAAKPHCDCG